MRYYPAGFYLLLTLSWATVVYPLVLPLQHRQLPAEATSAARTPNEGPTSASGTTQEQSQESQALGTAIHGWLGATVGEIYHNWFLRQPRASTRIDQGGHQPTAQGTQDDSKGNSPASSAGAQKESPRRLRWPAATAKVKKAASAVVLRGSGRLWAEFDVLNREIVARGHALNEQVQRCEVERINSIRSSLDLNSMKHPLIELYLRPHQLSSRDLLQLRNIQVSCRKKALEDFEKAENAAYGALRDIEDEKKKKKKKKEEDDKGGEDGREGEKGEEDGNDAFKLGDRGKEEGLGGVVAGGAVGAGVAAGALLKGGVDALGRTVGGILRPGVQGGAI